MIAIILAGPVAGCGSGDSGEDNNKKDKNNHLIHVVEVKQGHLAQQLVYPARVAANLTVRIHNRVVGEVIELPLYEGDKVEKGQLIAQLDDQLLRAELDKAIAEREQARTDVARLKKLVKKRAASVDELNQAQTKLNVSIANEKVLATKLGYSKLTSPIKGVISQRLVEPGDILKEHTHMLTIIDPDSLIVIVNIPEKLISELSVGSQAMVIIDALYSKKYEGKISRIHPALNDRSLNGTMEITLNELPPQLRAGQFARVRIEGLKRNRLVIPFPSLQRDEQGEFIYRLKDKIVERVSVASGDRLGNLVEIKGDVRAGDQVVRRGFLKLRAGKIVKVVKDNISR